MSCEFNLNIEKNAKKKNPQLIKQLTLFLLIAKLSKQTFYAKKKIKITNTQITLAVIRTRGGGEATVEVGSCGK